MTELLTAAETRRLERTAIEAGEVTGIELMERAGGGVVEAIVAEWPELADGPRRAVVLSGPGNNGGDGFVVARLLAEREWSVRVLRHGDPVRLPPDARTAYERWCKKGGVEELSPEAFDQDDTPPDLIVDALFGTGLGRPLDDRLADMLARLEDAAPEGTCWRVAVDVPSGLCADSGRVLDSELLNGQLPSRHDLTVTFHSAKPGHYLQDGPEWCGKVAVVDIGLGPSRFEKPTRIAEPSVWMLAKGGENRPRAHKFDHGHALVLSGGPGKGGAARMAARGALRVGAGLVTVGCPPAALQENASALDAIMLRPVQDADHLTEMLGDERLKALCIGPGFGLGEGTRAMVAAALEAGRATVLDGDALTAFADDPAALFAVTHERVVLTPHAGEFARLFPDLAERLKAQPTTGPAYSRLDAAREAAARAGCVVLLKGPDTVIAQPGGGAAINAAVYDRAAPWLATAGSGDVLAGFVTGLLARGLPAAVAAETAAWLHLECALGFGPGLVAEDLPEMLPSVFRDLGL